MKVKCPHCQKSVEWSTENRSRPFCSERCRLIDLGAWASESYRVPTDESMNDTEAKEFNASEDAENSMRYS